MDTANRQVTFVPSQSSAPVKVKGGGIFGKLSRTCASNGGTCLAIIIILAVVVIAMYVYYHGLFGIGPYSGSKSTGDKKAGFRKKKPTDDDAATDSPKDERADPQTERLIDTINSS